MYPTSSLTTAWATALRNHLGGWVGYALLAVVAVATVAVVWVGGIKMGVLFTLGLLGVPLLLICLGNLQVGIWVLLWAAFFIMGIKRFMPGEVPLGLFLDALLFLLFFGLFIKQLRRPDWSFANNVVGLCIVGWLIFNLLEFFNPVAASRLAWFYTVRGMAAWLLLYFIAMYAFNSLSYITLVMKTMIGLSLLAALYGLKQEFFGFNQGELNWLNADPERFELIYQWGRYRIFSFISDPTAYGILMGYMGLFCGVLALGPYKRWQKVVLAVCTMLLWWPVAYAGTRTAYILIPAGCIFYVMLNPTRRVLLVTAAMVVVGAAAMTKLTSNVIIYRIQSTFRRRKTLRCS